MGDFYQGLIKIWLTHPGLLCDSFFMKTLEFNTRRNHLTEKALGECLNVIFEGEEIIHKTIRFIGNYLNDVKEGKGKFMFDKKCSF